MRVWIAKPLNFESAHGILTKFYQKLYKMLPSIEKKKIDIGASTGQLAPKTSSKSINIFYPFYSSKMIPKNLSDKFGLF